MTHKGGKGDWYNRGVLMAPDHQCDVLIIGEGKASEKRLTLPAAGGVQNNVSQWPTNLLRLKQIDLFVRA